jgi:hypothetical protein
MIIVTRGSAALRTLVTWVVLIASRDGFFNPLKPNSQDYTNIFSKGSKFGQKWPFLDVLNAGKYRQIFAGIGIWSPEYRYCGIGIYRIGNTILDYSSQGVIVACCSKQKNALSIFGTIFCSGKR